MMHSKLEKFKKQFQLKSAWRQPSGVSKINFLGLMVGVLMGLVLLSSCSGGGGDGGGTGGVSGGVTALSLPGRITLTQAGGSGVGGASVNMATNHLLVGAANYDDPGSDYSEQSKDVWVEDTDALDLVNDILGVVADSAYAQFLNTGPYKALVRKVDDEVETQTGSSSTSATTENLMEITVDVTRASNASPMIIKVWVNEQAGGPEGFPMRIRGYFEVFAGVSEAYPLGRMEAHFKSNLLDENGDEIPGEVFTLALKVDADQDGNVIVESVDIGQEDPPGPEEEEWEIQLRLIANSSLSEGKAYIREYEYWTDGGPAEVEDNEDYVAFNADFYKEKEVGEAEAVYDKNNLFQKVFRYKLFEKEYGDLVARNSGFPI
jgi:hypothetical protein